MKNTVLTLIFLLILVLTGCSADHLINDKSLRERIRQDLIARIPLAKNREKELFSFRNENLPVATEEAMEFLYAYMPLSDLADYDGKFFQENSTLALRTRKETSWGKIIPEGIFLHYVLPVRVNNENLDSFRIKYFGEISDRVRGLQAMQAALEINHWCHEKVAYQPSDIRTSAPLSTILSARGRCGEESTFTVAALRAAGLPARQVYTPRWAHSDDNHAWVEVWIDSSWYYLGACEPEPFLDRGWFTEPARRAMLIHTKSFGTLIGEKNQINSHRSYSVINNLSKYAVTKTIYVKTMDSAGKPVAGADVEFQLYNYSEFYPLAVIKTGSDGLCSFSTGLGDLIIWAHRENRFSYRKITVNETDTLALTLDMKPEARGYHEYDLGVPLTPTPLKGPSQEMIRRNNERLDEENRIRQAYVDTWMKSSEAVKLAVSKGADTSAVKDFISRSMGNWKEIASFISATRSEDIPRAIKLLKLISDKDLRDTRARVLEDHLGNSPGFTGAEGYGEAEYLNFVLNPRIANEILTPWRGYFKNNLPVGLVAEVHDKPRKVVEFVKEQISVNDSDNFYMTPISPGGVDRLRVSDSFSRDIYYVAICRTLGIPARLEPGTNFPQYYSRGVWHEAFFSGVDLKEESRSYLQLTSKDNKPVPEYYVHFTLARFDGGKYKTLEYEYNRKISDFKDELNLTPGYYMLITGNRISDERILTSLTFFELKENEHRKIEVKLRFP